MLLYNYTFSTISLRERKKYKGPIKKKYQNKITRVFTLQKYIMNILTNLVYGIFNHKEPTALDRNQFSSWLTGFIDGENRVIS